MTTSDVYDHQEQARLFNLGAGTSDMDPPFFPIYERCREYTMTSVERMFALYKAVEYLQNAGIEGDFVECGVWRGGSMMVAAETVKLYPGPARTLHLFDTFEGLPEPSVEDVDLGGHQASEWWGSKATSTQSSDWCRCGIEEVTANMALTGIQAEHVKLVKGMVEDTIPEHAPDKIALLRLDTDWYASSKHEMVHLFPRIVPGGVLIVDDYGHYKGARQATDEYFAEHKVPILLMRVDYTGRIAVCFNRS